MSQWLERYVQVFHFLFLIHFFLNLGNLVFCEECVCVYMAFSLLWAHGRVKPSNPHTGTCTCLCLRAWVCVNVNFHNMLYPAAKS